MLFAKRSAEQPLEPELQEVLERNRIGDEMGAGDKRTFRGKVFRGSYGNTRPHDPNKKKAPPKRAAARPAGGR